MTLTACALAGCDALGFECVAHRYTIPPDAPCYTGSATSRRGREAGGGTSASAVALSSAPPLPELDTPMADSGNSTFFSPYPGIFSQPNGDNADAAYRAALTSHSAASIERNADAQFAAGRAQAIHRDVEASKLTTVQATLETERGARQADRESARQFAELKAELAAMRAENLQREVTALRDGAQAKALADILSAVKALNPKA